MKIVITTDSTCDLGAQAEKRDIVIMPLLVVLGTETYEDGISVTLADIFSYVEKTGTLPKTAAPSATDYEEFFSKYVAEGNTVIHFSISDKSSSAHAYAKKGAEKFEGQVYVVDSMGLSTGQGLLVLKAADMRDSGMSAQEIVAKCLAIAPNINTSFVPDRLDYLHKGGRCSGMAMLAASILKIHPLIEMENGQLLAKKKYHGSMQKCIRKYVADLVEKYPTYDKTRCFVTHSSADPELVEFAINEVKSHFCFDEIIETVAGSVITGHCGRNTLGVLFVVG
jgi:DegV family protein with EDD domain